VQRSHGSFKEDNSRTLELINYSSRSSRCFRVQIRSSCIFKRLFSSCILCKEVTAVLKKITLELINYSSRCFRVQIRSSCILCSASGALALFFLYLELINYSSLCSGKDKKLFFLLVSRTYKLFEFVLGFKRARSLCKTFNLVLRNWKVDYWFCKSS
jgi:hypothetical protein